MMSQLDTALTDYNAGSRATTVIRLRVALHAGEVHHDPHGVAGCAVNHVFRLIETRAFKTALRASTGSLAAIASAWFYEEVIRHYPVAEPTSYRRVRVRAVNGAGWIRLFR